jgi:hypothetical protein
MKQKHSTATKGKHAPGFISRGARRTLDNRSGNKCARQVERYEDPFIKGLTDGTDLLRPFDAIGPTNIHRGRQPHFTRTLSIGLSRLSWKVALAERRLIPEARTIDLILADLVSDDAFSGSEQACGFAAIPVGGL